MRHYLSSSLLILLTAGAAARTAPALPGVSRAVESALSRKEVAGAVTLVATRDRILHLDATGEANTATREKMRPDTLFAIASMTKPVTAAAVMMLQDEGKLSVEDPVSRYIPEMAGLKTADGKSHAVTIQHLLTHTSGMGEINEAEARSALTLADAVKLYAGKPLAFAPGTQWRYSQSSINTAARVVEVVSGQSFPEFLSRRLFGPLGMKDTTFYPSAAQAKRLAKLYRREESGAQTEVPSWILLGKEPTSTDRFPAANAGLFSTAPNYARFCQMILNDGEFRGQRLLSVKAVRQMTGLQTGDLSTGFTEGNGWGLGWCVVRRPQGASGALSSTSFGHGGAFGTQAWIDPLKGVAYILMVQRANYPNADNSDLRREFQQAALSALR